MKNKKTALKKIKPIYTLSILLLIIESMMSNVNAQNLILNPGFESNSLTTGCYVNQSAASVSSSLDNVTAFYGGTLDGIEIGVDDQCYAGGANSGTTHIVMAGLSGPNMFESISFDLSSPIVSGQTYNLLFYASNSTSSSTESLSVGISSSATSYGTQAVLVPLGSNNTYTQYSATFTAPIGGDYLTIEPGAIGNFWFGLDDFYLELVCPPSNGTDTRTECDSYTWIDGNTYTASNNSATHTLTNAAGCDSVVTLNLTMNYSNTGVDTRIECDSYTWIDGNTYTTSNSTATYTLTNTAGCDSVVTLNLTVNNVTNITTSVSGQTIIAANGNATYQWLDCDNNYSIIPLEINQGYTPATNGNYAVELTENSCVDTTACVSITTVGVVENSFGEKFTIYPNPTDGNFSVDLGDVYEKAEILITDLSGKLIASKTITQSQTLNLSLKEPAGIYIVSVQAGEKKAVIRLIKE